jgi:hypothetical protein
MSELPPNALRPLLGALVARLKAGPTPRPSRSVFRFRDGVNEPLNILPIIIQNIRLQGIEVGSVVMFEEMNRAISVSGLRPVIDIAYYKA